MPDFLRAKKRAEEKTSALIGKDLATTYSRRSYTTTTIGKTAFDGRVRDGNGSVHSFMVTKKLVLEWGERFVPAAPAKMLKSTAPWGALVL
jgi:hypothetical protein